MTVFVDQTVNDLGPLDGSGAVATNVDVGDGRQLLQGSMRPMRVVVVALLRWSIVVGRDRLTG